MCVCVCARARARALLRLSACVRACGGGGGGRRRGGRAYVRVACVCMRPRIRVCMSGGCRGVRMRACMVFSRVSVF